MPPRSAFATLDPALLAELDALIVANGFGNYQGIVDWLATRGVEVSVATAWRHGSALERKLQAVRDATMGARAIAEATPDDADMRSAAVLSLVQTELFNTLVALREADDADDPADRLKIIARAGQGIAQLARASTSQKRFEQEWRDKARTKLDQVESKVKSEGLTAEQTLAMIRNAYGF